MKLLSIRTFRIIVVAILLGVLGGFVFYLYFHILNFVWWYLVEQRTYSDFINQPVEKWRVAPVFLVALLLSCFSMRMIVKLLNNRFSYQHLS